MSSLSLRNKRAWIIIHHCLVMFHPLIRGNEGLRQQILGLFRIRIKECCWFLHMPTLIKEARISWWPGVVCIEEKLCLRQLVKSHLAESGCALNLLILLFLHLVCVFVELEMVMLYLHRIAAYFEVLLLSKARWASPWTVEHAPLNVNWRFTWAVLITDSLGTVWVILENAIVLAGLFETSG